MEIAKPCKKCGVEKPLKDFYACERMKDGHFNTCKACVSATYKARYKPRQKPDYVIDEVGNRYGRLVVESRAETRNGKAYWNCVCDCGCAACVWGNSLRRGGTKSCGCLSAEAIRRTKHGLAGTRVCSSWHAMMARCYKPTCASYPDYGGRGIAVCERWRNSMNAYYEDMGDPPGPTYTIDRKDNDGDYCKENCRWATKGQQSRNNRRTRLVTIDGRTMCLKDWAAELNVNYLTLFRRMRAGKTPEQALGVMQ